VKGLESLLRKEKDGKFIPDSKDYKATTKAYNKAYWAGVVTSSIGDLAGTALTFFATGNPYLAVTAGAAVGDYLGYEVGFAPTWYYHNRDRYKGVGGKFKFLKENFMFNVRELVPDIATYAVSAGLAVGLVYLGMGPVLASAAVGLGELLFAWGGGRYFNRKYFRRVAAEKKTSSYSPQPATAKT